MLDFWDYVRLFDSVGLLVMSAASLAFLLLLLRLVVVFTNNPFLLDTMPAGLLWGSSVVVSVSIVFTIWFFWACALTSRKLWDEVKRKVKSHA